ncbi:hypothetical protein HRbin32_00563 [bacterium HR32]|nr:hypothetical protein HRbin32_00563 [bacterium HR32]
MDRDRVMTLAWMAAIGVGGLLPPLGPSGFQPGGTLYHLVGFSVLTVLLSRTLPWARAAAVAWLYGVLLEGVQAFFPYRGAEVADLAVNLVAVVLGLVAVAVRRAWQAAS